MTPQNSTPFRLLLVALAVTVAVGGVLAVPAAATNHATAIQPTPGPTAGDGPDVTTAASAVDRPATAEDQATPAPAATAADLRLEVVERTESTVTVSLSTTAEDTMAYAAGLAFNPAIVTVESVDGADFSAPYANVEDGTVTFTQSTVPDDAVDAPELARITFSVVDDGETTLAFVDDDTVVENVDAESIPLSTQGVTIDVDGGSGGLPGPGETGTDDERDSADVTVPETNGSAGDDATDDPAGDGSDGGSAGAGSPDSESVGGGDNGVPGFTPGVAAVAIVSCIGLLRSRSG
ncbi:hypothetical protein [Halovivax cerinus]|uniref:Cohesin domain-containing protein n=1 Tax=Halovivax cerinus TaxID=1487865 RepID=A0ABD5NQN0_9EURY|nr:hypothetical protein [Halovivax cerinus]